MDLIREIRTFIDFDDEDVQRLQALTDHLEPAFDGFVDTLCDVLERSHFTRTLVDSESKRRDVAEAVDRWLRRIFREPFVTEEAGRRHELATLDISEDWLPELLYGALHSLRTEIRTHIRRLDIPRAGRAAASFEKAFDYELIRLMRRQREANLKQQFDTAATLAAGLSHEIYNPLNSITLNLSLLERQLREKVNGEMDWAPMLTAVRNEVQRIGMFTSELSDFSRPLSIEARWFDAEVLLEDLLKTHAQTLDSVGVDLETRIDGPSTIYGDPDRIEEALLNLLHNAVEALGESGAIEIRLRNNAVTTLEVSDTGPGIDPQDRNKIFDLFFTTKASGTGLGLPLVRKIAEAHNGKAEVLGAQADADADTESRGATFRLTLPRPERDG